MDTPAWARYRSYLTLPARQHVGRVEAQLGPVVQLPGRQQWGGHEEDRGEDAQHVRAPHQHAHGDSDQGGHAA